MDKYKEFIIQCCAEGISYERIADRVAIEYGKCIGGNAISAYCKKHNISKESAAYGARNSYNASWKKKRKRQLGNPMADLMPRAGREAKVICR